MQGNGKDIETTAAACIDAETLAAWADGGLPKAEAALVEVHLADCDRCTAMLATFVRTEPPAQAADSLWSRWQLRWLVPIATAATVAALWVIAPTQRPASEMARMEVSTESTTPPAASSVQVQPPEAQEQPQEQSAPTESAAADNLERRVEKPRAAPQLAEERKDANAKLAQPATANETFAAAPPPPAPEAERREAREPDATQERFSTLAGASAPAPAVAAPAAAATAPAPAAPPPATPSADTARARGGAIATLRSQPFSTTLLEIVSPDPKTRWRVVGPGQVERSLDGGTRWERATLPESATLTAGASPSPSVVWLIGRTGGIYVTTDGLRFTRVPFPDRTDFVSIQALDARRATVVTIDGRTMRTEDQGATWIRVSP